MLKSTIDWKKLIDDYLPSESRSPADIRGFVAFQKKQASLKEQAPSSLAARNSSYDDDVVSENFIWLHE